jgi:hypothetical protein
MLIMGGCRLATQWLEIICRLVHLGSIVLVCLRPCRDTRFFGAFMLSMLFIDVVSASDGRRVRQRVDYTESDIDSDIDSGTETEELSDVEFEETPSLPATPPDSPLSQLDGVALCAIDALQALLPERTHNEIMTAAAVINPTLNLADRATEAGMTNAHLEAILDAFGIAWQHVHAGFLTAPENLEELRRDDAEILLNIITAGGVHHWVHVAANGHNDVDKPVAEAVWAYLSDLFGVTMITRQLMSHHKPRDTSVNTSSRRTLYRAILQLHAIGAHEVPLAFNWLVWLASHFAIKVPTKVRSNVRAFRAYIFSALLQRARAQAAFLTD